MGLTTKLAWVALPALVGCGMLSPVSSQGAGSSPEGKALSSATGLLTSKNTNNFGYANEHFEVVGDALDNPQEIFRRAGYQQLWTLDAPSERMPKGLSVVPKRNRVWEPWFRKHLTFNGEQLSTADLIKLKWIVVQTVANDPGAQFRPGQSDNEVFQGVENARKKALSSLGMSDSNISKPLMQITRADAAWAWCRSQRSYSRSATISPVLRSIEETRYPTFTELNSRDFALNCSRSNLLYQYLLRGLEKHSPSGLKVGSCYVFRFDNNSQMLAHGLNGVVISMQNGQTAHLLYDPTADRNGFQQGGLGLVVKDCGPIEAASIERYGNLHSIVKKKDESPMWGRDGSGGNGAFYQYILGENWDFSIGNFNFSATLPDGGESYKERRKGIESFSRYHSGNTASIRSLSQTIDQIVNK